MEETESTAPVVVVSKDTEKQHKAPRWATRSSKPIHKIAIFKYTMTILLLCAPTHGFNFPRGPHTVATRNRPIDILSVSSSSRRASRLVQANRSDGVDDTEKRSIWRNGLSRLKNNKSLLLKVSCVAVAVLLLTRAGPAHAAVSMRRGTQVMGESSSRYWPISPLYEARRSVMWGNRDFFWGWLVVSVTGGITLWSRGMKALALFNFCLMVPFLLPRSGPFLMASRSARVAVLGRTDLVLGALLVTMTSGLSLWHRRLTRLSRQLMWACARCSVQLYLLGTVVLDRLIGTRQPQVVGAWIVGVGVVAALQSYSRLEHRYDSLFRHLLISILASTTFVLGISLWAGILGEYLRPWFKPRVVIPVAGMLFGNAISATSLAASSLTRAFAQRWAAVELRLARGASPDEALRPLVRVSLSEALTPTINMLAVTGTVHIPGLMTGSLLAGQSPQQASAYQAMILFMVASTSCLSAQLLTWFATHKLMDFNDMRLAVDQLRRREEESRFQALTDRFRRRRARDRLRDDPKMNIRDNTRGKGRSLIKLENVEEPIVRTLHGALVDDTSNPVLTVKKLRVRRAGHQVSFVCRQGDRIGITGPSGAGKTQLLRTVAGLEHVSRDSLMTLWSAENQPPWPSWRQQVCYVSQDRPALEGTPNDLFDELRTYKSRRYQQPSLVDEQPKDIARYWDLNPDAFHQSWSTLSGGEAQRCSLAIAVALKPQILLLDEAMSALDPMTQELVERTFLERRIPVVMVTHSFEQLERFCTHHLELTVGRGNLARGERGFQSRDQPRFGPGQGGSQGLSTVFYEPSAEWLILRKSEGPAGNNYYLLSRSSFTNEMDFDNLVVGGDASPIHPSFYYICRSIDQVAEEYHQLVPGFGYIVKEALHACAKLSNADFALQRCRFKIFECFAQMATRRLVAEYMASFHNDAWPSQEHVAHALERDVIGRWLDWFVEDEEMRDYDEISFVRELSQHYAQLQTQVFENEQWQQEQPF